jgi:Domain of unknown function DUF11
MRKRIWLLASCGVVGMGIGLAAADAPPSNPADDFAAASLTDPVATSPSDDAKPAVAKQPAVKPAASSSKVVNADQAIEAPDAAAASAKEPKLIHAEYRTQAGTGERARVRLVGGTAEANPFDDPIDATAKIEKSAQVGSATPAAPSTPSSPAAAPVTPAEAAPHLSRSTRVTLSDTAISGGHDATQAPLVTVHWEKKSPLAVGRECACDLVIKNTGKLAASDVSVEAYFPATVRLTHSEPMPSDNQDHVTWSFSSVAAGEEKVVHVAMVPSKRGDLATTALVRFSAQSSNVFVVEEPMLNLSVRGPKELMIGDPATQSITIGNPGTGVAHNVVIEARLTKGLEHPHGERLTIQVGSLNPGETRQVRLPLVAIAGGPQAIKIHASAAGDLRREITTKITVVAPSVKVTAEGPSFRYVGCKAAYVINVASEGGASNNVHVTHTLPEGFRFVRADKGGEYDETTRTVNWFISHLEAKESARLKVELATTEIGTHAHKFVAVAEQGARSDAKIDTVVDGMASPEIEIIPQNNPVAIGVETAYEIHIRNDGTKAAENVSVGCELPEAVEILRAEGASTGTLSTTEKGLLAFHPIPRIEPGKTAIYRVYVRGNKPGNHRFRVHLTADSIKEPLVSDEMSKFYAD